MEELKRFYTDFAQKLYAICHLFVLLMLLNFSAATCEKAYDLPVHSVLWGLLAIAIAWEMLERLILVVRIWWQRKKRGTHGRK